MNANLTRACILGSIAISGWVIAPAHAETTTDETNPYSVISDKNVFHLNPPPPPAPIEVAKPPDLQKVMLSGFQKKGDHTRVYLAIPAKDPKETAYLSLQVGEKEHDVEIVKIRADKQEVDIINSGTPMTLNIASNGFTVTAASAMARAAAAPPPMGFGNRRLPGVGLPGAPPPNMPVPGNPAAASGGNSRVIMSGGNDGDSSAAPTAANSYGGGPIVSGGRPAYAPPPNVGVPNNPAAQIANSLFSGGAQQYHPPVPGNVRPAPAEVQAAEMLVNQAAGGPPSPVEAPPDQ